MADWFTIDRIDGDTFAISEYRHWEETHCYLLLGTERALLIDTGLGVADIGAVVRTVTRLPMTVVTTHVHWDHIGGHGCFDTIAVHEQEQDWLDGRFPLPPQVVRACLKSFDKREGKADNKGKQAGDDGECINIQAISAGKSMKRYERI